MSEDTPTLHRAKCSFVNPAFGNVQKGDHILLTPKQSREFADFFTTADTPPPPQPQTPPTSKPKPKPKSKPNAPKTKTHRGGNKKGIAH